MFKHKVSPFHTILEITLSLLSFRKAEVDDNPRTLVLMAFPDDDVMDRSNLKTKVKGIYKESVLAPTSPCMSS